MTATAVNEKLNGLAIPEVAASAARFFKTRPGQYSEGDIFIGVRIPALRKLAGEFRDLSLTEIEILLHSPIHEERMLALTTDTSFSDSTVLRLSLTPHEGGVQEIKRAASSRRNNFGREGPVDKCHIFRRNCADCLSGHPAHDPDSAGRIVDVRPAQFFGVLSQPSE